VVANRVTLYALGGNAGDREGESVGGVGGPVVGECEEGKWVGLDVCADDGRVGAAVGDTVAGTVLKHAHIARYEWLHSVTDAPNGELNHWYVFVPVKPTMPCSTTELDVHPTHLCSGVPAFAWRVIPVYTYCDAPIPAADESGTNRLDVHACVQLRAIMVPPGENTGVLHEKETLEEGTTHAEYGYESSAWPTNIHVNSQLSWLAGSEAQIASLAARDVPNSEGVYVFVVKNTMGVRREMG
jgi:hypothetical protein